MPKPVATYLNELFDKAGVPADNQARKDLLSNADLSKINMSDDLLGIVEANIHTLDSAKPKLKADLRKEILGETFSTINSELDNIASERGFDDNSRAALKAETNSYNRIKLVAAKIAELEAAKAGASKGDKSELQTKINELQAAQAKLQQEYDAKLKQTQDAATEQINELYLENMLSRYQYAGEADIEDKIALAKIRVNRMLAESGAKTINDPKNPKSLILVNQDGTEYYDKGNNKKDLKSFVEGAIAPILSTTKPADPGDGNTPAVTVPAGGPKVNHSVMAKLDAEIQQASMKATV